MKKLLITLSFISSILMVSCSSGADEILPSGERVEILPTTNIAGIEVGNMSRGGGALNSALTSPIDISIFRADETTPVGNPANYASSWSGAVALGAQVAIGGDVTFTTSQFYKTDDRKHIKLIGVYPAVTTNWSDTNGQVTYTIDGATDIMATPFAESVKGGAQPALAFGHLLTQIQVSVIAEANAADLWGNIEAVSVTGRANSCVVQLPMPNAATAPATSFSGTADLDVWKADGTAIPALTPTLAEQEFGICMFAPITSSEVLPLSVTTSVGGTVPVEVPTSTYAAGTAYKIQLVLTAKGIQPTATLADWVEDTDDPTSVEM